MKNLPIGAGIIIVTKHEFTVIDPLANVPKMKGKFGIIGGKLINKDATSKENIKDNRKTNRKTKGVKGGNKHGKGSKRSRVLKRAGKANKKHGSKKDRG